MRHNPSVFLFLYWNASSSVQSNNGARLRMVLGENVVVIVEKKTGV